MLKKYQLREYKCEKCDKIYSSSSSLGKHSKTCTGTETKKEENNSSSSDMLMMFMKKMQELEEENKRLKLEIEQKNNQCEEFQSSKLDYDPPYDKDQLTKAIYKYNPYTRQYSIRRGGFTSKDIKSWYVPKYFNILEYPETNIQFYKKCLTEILKNIPTDKLPYKVRDAGRYLYDIYDYSEQRWIRGKTNNLIRNIIKLIISIIYSSLTSAINVMNEIDTNDFYALECRRINPTTFNTMRRYLQTDLIHKFSLPDYDNELTSEEIDNFYKKNFIKILTNRLKDNEIDDEEIEEEDTEPLFYEETKPRKYNINYDDDDNDGYDTDTDIKNNPYL